MAEKHGWSSRQAGDRCGNGNNQEGTEMGKHMEDKWIKQLRESAEEMEIPESLCPDQIEKKLEGMKKELSAGERRTPLAVFHRWFSDAQRLSANRLLPVFYGMGAAVLLLGCVYAVYRNGLVPGIKEKETADVELLTKQEAESGEEPENSERAENSEKTENSERTENSYDIESSAWVEESLGAEKGEKAGRGRKKQDAGDLYRVASDYGEVQDVIRQSLSYWQQTDLIVDGYDGYMVKEEVSGEDAEPGEVEVRGLEKEDSTISGAVVGQQEPGYSTTNLQVEGVDESDIVKTDGSYLYTVKADTVHITDIRDGKLSAAGEISLPQNQGANEILEMYVDGNRLVLIASEKESRLEREEREDYPEYYYFDTLYFTAVYTYDIEEKGDPRLMGKVTQEGYYDTSRKIGDIVYLFTNYYAGESLYDGEAEVEEWIPRINGESVLADHIYIPRRGAQSLIVSSVDLENPDETLDHVMILHDGVEIYVSPRSIYLYNRDYSSGMVSTQIARFSLDNGFINAAAAGSVSGYVTDTFAVSEGKDSFRILTTDNGGDLGNCLYIYDLDLNLKASLKGIAPDEQIYAARYFEDFAYFVTYRNMDPLFAVDLSDEEHPKLLGELKITGYSDYLHVWEEGKLLGIGYETDPDTGQTKGIKIAMFDVSAPQEMKTIDSLVIKNADYSPALHAYKTVLVNRNANLVGFPVETCENRAYGWYGTDYLLFEWENGSFHSLLSFSLEEGIGAEDCRGLYVGKYFYIVSPGSMIISFDRENDYQETDRISF